jgi:hypothetical protein
MDPAAAAAMSDPDRNKWFRRRWSEPLHVRKSCPRTPDPEEALKETSSTIQEHWRRELVKRPRGVE